MWQIDLIKKIFVSSCEMYSMQQQLLMAAETFSPVFLYYIYLRHFRSIMNYHAIMYRLPHCIHLLHGKIFTYGLFFAEHHERKLKRSADMSQIQSAFLTVRAVVGCCFWRFHYGTFFLSWGHFLVILCLSNINAALNVIHKGIIWIPCTKFCIWFISFADRKNCFIKKMTKFSS